MDQPVSRHATAYHCGPCVWLDRTLQLLHQAAAGMVVAAPAAAYAAFLEAASALYEGDVAMALTTAGAVPATSANASSRTAHFSLGLPVTEDDGSGGSTDDDVDDDEQQDEDGREAELVPCLGLVQGAGSKVPA